MPGRDAFTTRPHPTSSPSPVQPASMRPPGVLAFFFVICTIVTVWGLALSSLSSREGEAERHAHTSLSSSSLSPVLSIPAAGDEGEDERKSRRMEGASEEESNFHHNLDDYGIEETSPRRPNMPVTAPAPLVTAERDPPPVSTPSPVGVDLLKEEDRNKRSDPNGRRAQQGITEQHLPSVTSAPAKSSPSTVQQRTAPPTENANPQADPPPTTTSQPSTRTRYLYVIDYWERLNNIHRAMRNLVRVATVANYTLVEPFMFESMVTQRLCTPAQFATARLQVQTASKYMNLTRAFAAGLYTTYDHFEQNVAKRTDGDGVLVDAAAYIFDNDTPFDVPPTEEDPFFDCENIFRALNYTYDDRKGWKIAPGLHAARPICINGIRERKDAPADSFMRAIYEKLEGNNDDISTKAVVCPECTSLIVLNYRKHFIGRFGFRVQLDRPSKPFPPSAFGMSLAAKWKVDVFDGQPYVAVQYRTGKTLTLFRDMAQWMHERPYVRDVVMADYRTWVFGCADKLINGALMEREALRKLTGIKGRIPVFLASDMYNEGWKHGEYSGVFIKPIMEDLKQYVDRRFDGVVSFNPEIAGIEQDVMGLSAVGDAAIAFAADWFVTHAWSSMGQYVKENRAVWRNVGSRVVVCEEPDKNETIIRRINNALEELAGS